MRRRFRLSPRPMLQISPRSLDQRLRGEQRKGRRRLDGGTKPGTLLLKDHLPLKTDHGDVRVPGFTEIDRVSHSGDSASGVRLLAERDRYSHGLDGDPEPCWARVRKQSEPLWQRSRGPALFLAGD
jgi:hypothetical protein